MKYKIDEKDVTFISSYPSCWWEFKSLKIWVQVRDSWTSLKTVCWSTMPACSSAIMFVGSLVERGVGWWFPSSSNFYSFFAVWKKFLILVAIDFCEFGVHGLWIMPFTEPSGTDGVGIWILKLQYFLQPNIGEGVGCKLLSICYAVYFGHNAKLSKLPNLFSYWKYKYYD